MNTEMDVQKTEEDLFTEQDVFHFEDASRNQRFLNFLIDNVLMNYGLSWASGYAVGYFLITFFPDFYQKMVLEKGVEWYLTIYLIALLNYIFYYTFSEKVFNGYTLGKLITGTRAVREDGTELRFRDALLRSLSRMVPFEAFSGFGRPWHDSWTKTMVIKSR